MFLDGNAYLAGGERSSQGGGFEIECVE